MQYALTWRASAIVAQPGGIVTELRGHGFRGDAIKGKGAFDLVGLETGCIVLHDDFFEGGENFDVLDTVDGVGVRDPLHHFVVKRALEGEMNLDFGQAVIIPKGGEGYE